MITSLVFDPASRGVAAVLAAVLLLCSNPVPAHLLDSSGLGCEALPAASYTCSSVKVDHHLIGAKGHDYEFSGVCTQVTSSIKSSGGCVSNKSVIFDVKVNAAWDVAGKKAQEKVVAKEKGGSRTDTINSSLECNDDPWLHQTNNACKVLSINSTTKYTLSGKEVPLSRFVIPPAEAKALLEGSQQPGGFLGRFAGMHLAPQELGRQEVVRPRSPVQEAIQGSGKPAITTAGADVVIAGPKPPVQPPGSGGEPTGPTALTITQPMEGQAFALGSQIFINVGATGTKPQKIKVTWQKTGANGSWVQIDSNVDADLKLIPWNQLPKQITDPNLATGGRKYRFRVQVEGSTTWTPWRTYEIKAQSATSGKAPAGTSGSTTSPTERMQQSPEMYRPAPTSRNRPTLDR